MASVAVSWPCGFGAAPRQYAFAQAVRNCPRNALGNDVFSVNEPFLGSISLKCLLLNTALPSREKETGLLHIFVVRR